MGLVVSLHAIDDLTDAEIAARQALQAAVFPPERFPIPPGSHLEWSAPQWTIHVHDEALVTFGDLFVRDIRHDDNIVRIGGVGNVKTHPDARRRGCAKLLLERSLRYFQERTDIDFALLVCEPRLFDYYARLGWRPFTGELFVMQRGIREIFTFASPMVHDIRGTAPTAGTIDLLGPPW